MSIFEALDIVRGRGRAGRGWSYERKFGHNADIDTSWEDLWDAGGTYSFPTAAAAVRVAAGGDAADTAAGAGARSVTIKGLDENWAIAEETVDTAGAAASSYTTTTFIRVFRANVATVGTYGVANTAAITIESAANTLAIIPAGAGQTQMALWTVPADKTAFLVGLAVDLESAKPISFRLLQRQNADDTSAPMSPLRLVSEFPADADPIRREYRLPVEFPAKTDLICKAKRSSTGTGEVSAEMDIVIIDADKA